MRVANMPIGCVCLVVAGACASGEITDTARERPGAGAAPPAAHAASASTSTGAGVSPVAAPNGQPSATAAPPEAPALTGGLADQSRAAFATTLYPLLQANCSGCHSSAGARQLPLHSDVDVNVAFEAAQRKVNLRQPDASRFIKRLAVDHHHCWSDCVRDAAGMRAAIQAWVGAVAQLVPPIQMPVPERAIDEATVLQWIAADKAKLGADAATYVRYASLHALYEKSPNQDDLNSARTGLSKVLNSTARYAPKVVNPVAIDPYALVYRFDVRDYWGFARTGANSRLGASGPIEPNPARALEIWQRVAQGNTAAEGADAKTATFPNNAGFHAEYVEATQLAYTLTRPDVYNEIMNIPFLASALERELEVDRSKGVESYQYMTVNDAITLTERLMYRASMPDGYYWRSVDQFSMTKFVFYEHPVPKFIDQNYSQIVTTRLDQEGEGFNIAKEYDGSTGIQAQASEVIFSLPNGLQAYAIFGAGNQRRVDAFTFIVVDPRRATRGLRLLNGVSCISCHTEGMNRAPDDMEPYLDANATRFDAATMTQLRTLYPGNAVMRQRIEDDRVPFMAAMKEIADAMIVGTEDKQVYNEPIGFMAEIAGAIHGYVPTESN